ncbi:autophagy-related protein 13-domain-containing protein [Triangularia verruculosa]|uniref:Autophagy-related protein 13 n=1 Tax=Triangularia verruculosa TaxID=2587418 RepID=A0AAN6XIR7_9PEZI|nr:autophagy-related protein 13-domain-containing protein [Triangularia verruculosa]
MHQQSRHPPRVSSPASSPQTNPTRTNNPRDRIRAGSDVAAPDGPPGPDSAKTPPDTIKKLDQIIQNLYVKAAVLVLGSRVNLTPALRRNPDGTRVINKWFSIDTDDTDDFRQELRIYKVSATFESPPPPMVIETYIDASSLNNSQSLVIIDDNGKRWDVLEALNSSETSDDGFGSRRTGARNTEVILERWRFELKDLSTNGQGDFAPVLPTLYKRAIVFFRSLFVTTRIMPCFKYSQQTLAKGRHPALEVKCRVLTEEPEYLTTYDPLRQPLYDGDGRDAVTTYDFPDLDIPVARFSASVTYRTDCNFRVDASESLLSSRFMVEENFFRPTIQQHTQRRHGRSDSYAEPGSLPAHRPGRDAPGLQQTYGSLSTFHGEGALGTSPITALRQVRPIGSDTSSPSESTSASLERPSAPQSLPIRGAITRPSLRTGEEGSRRPSVSFQPFKAGSVSGSPRLADADVPPSPQSLSRPSGLSQFSRSANRSSLTAGMAASLRGPSVPPQDVPVVTGSPKPGNRYSSSFTHRRGRLSFGGQSRGDDDQASSGKQSLSSSAQPGSGLLTEAGGIASSGSFVTDDDNISEFLKALDSHKTLKSFEVNGKGESSASKRTANQLSKYQMMRETNNALTDSMASSMHLQRSSSTSSRQLGNVPSMVNPASMSTSTSPGKPLSPHTPHTPAIPSRLSENSIIDYQSQGQVTRRAGRSSGVTVAEEDEGEDLETPVAQEAGRGTGAIDIPLSPRLYHVGNPNRRSSSAVQQHRSLAADVESYPGQRSASVEAGASADKDVPTLSTLLAYQHGGRGAETSAAAEGSSAGNKDGSESLDGVPPAAIASPFGSRGIRYPVRANRPSSFSSARFGTSVETPTDGEPLLFDMSELGPGRRSLEDRSNNEREQSVRGVLRKGW